MATYEKNDLENAHHEYLDVDSSNEKVHETQRTGSVSSRLGSLSGGRRVSIADDVFGEIKEGGVNYRNVCRPLLLFQIFD